MSMWRFMYKGGAGLLGGLMVLSMGMASNPAYGLSTSGTLPTSITVGGTFRLTLAKWKGGPVSDSTRFDLIPVTSLDFGSVAVGQTSTNQPTSVVPLTGGGTAESGLIMKTETNQGNVWRLQVSENQPLTRTGGSQTIADSNFRFFTWIVTTTNPPEASGTLTALPGGSQTMSTTPFTVYTSSPGEGLTTDTRVHAQWNITVPSVTPGTYTNNVIITLTE